MEAFRDREERESVGRNLRVRKSQHSSRQPRAASDAAHARRVRAQLDTDSETHLGVPSIDPEDDDRHCQNVHASKQPLRAFEALAASSQARDGRVQVDVEGRVAARVGGQRMGRERLAITSVAAKRFRRALGKRGRVEKRWTGKEEETALCRPTVSLHHAVVPFAVEERLRLLHVRAEVDFGVCGTAQAQGTGQHAVEPSDVPLSTIASTHT